jgi:hypothetical protein
MKFWQLPVALLCLFLSGCSLFARKPSTAPEQTPPPKLLAPSVKKIWIPASIKNGGIEWEEGHFIYKIERETTWSR